MSKEPIKLHQIWKQKGNSSRIMIFGQKGGKWKAKVLTEKENMFAGTHTLSPMTIRNRFELLK